MKAPGPAAAGVLLLAAWLLWPAGARAVYECGGETDTCSCGRDNYCLCDGTCGNCVWHAWHMACCEWGRALEWCTDAGTWDAYAPQNGYPTGSVPRDRSVFVCDPSAVCSDYGHVGWVVSAYPDGSFDSTEQYWGGPCGTHERHREAGFATAGFIYDPAGGQVDDAAFVSETVPDGSRLAAGQAFTKRWTMRNTGTSTWTRSEQVLWTFDGEERFSAAEQTLLPDGVAVEPGQSWDWDVAMVAPAAPGTYRGYWRMDRYGTARFGQRVWVEIVVDPPADEDGGIEDGGADDGGAGDGGAGDPGAEDAGVGDGGGIEDGGADVGGESEPPAADAGPADPQPGCGCGAGGGSPAALWPLLGLAWLRLRRPAAAPTAGRSCRSRRR